ncbi:MAG: hypothetical protein GQ574_12265 [Crocinitomix sp.]|nr:hypothetical protein [Crocinitomix sp.]
MKHLLLLLIPFLIACESSGRFNVDKVTAIHYEFYTDRVVEDVHNDYEIYIKPGEALFVANSFGNEVARQSTEINDEALSKLVEKMNSSNLEDGSELTEEACINQINEHLTVFEENLNVYNSTLVYCPDDSPRTTENLGDLAGTFEAIFALVPGFDDLIKK